MNLKQLFAARPDGRKVRYAVVGAGWIAQEDFLPAVEHTGNSLLAALVSGDDEKRIELGRRYHIPKTCDYDGFEALLRSGMWTPCTCRSQIRCTRSSYCGP